MTGKVTFFMLVTERDCIIADYAIASYDKIYRERKPFGGSDFTLFIYLNSLSAKSKDVYLNRWQAWPFTRVFDNETKLHGLSQPYPGEEIISPEGFVRRRDDYAESYDELWTTELRRFTTPFIATVDADFEILHPDFYFDLMQQLTGDPNAIAASSDYSETSALYESYSDRHITLSRRNHTWFCIYKKEAFERSAASHFYYEETDAGGKLVCYDSAAWFQEQLRRQGLTFLHSTLTGCFVHYGASSKNRSLTRETMPAYRRAFKLSAIGLIIGPGGKFTRLVNKLTRKIAMRFFSRYLGKFSRERSRYIYEVDQVQ